MGGIPAGEIEARLALLESGADVPLIEALRRRSTQHPGRETFERAAMAADAMVDATIGKRMITAGFAEHGPDLLTRFSEWARLIATSWHESAHAVAGWALGRRPTRATVIPEEECDGIVLLGAVYGVTTAAPFGRDDPRRASRESAIVAFAGDIADEPFCRASCPGARARKWFSKYGFEKAIGRGTDRHHQLAAGWDYSDEPFEVGQALDHWRGETVALLARYAVEVERVAVALMERRELDEAALSELLGPIRR